MTQNPTLTRRPISQTAKVLSLTPRGKNLYQLTLKLATLGPFADPGLFARLRSWGPAPAAYPLLDRPFSIHRYRPNQGELDFLIRPVGLGTNLLTQCRLGDPIQLLGPLGQGLGNLIPDYKNRPFYLVAGGVGLAPMANLIDQSKGPNHLFYGEREGQSLIDKAYLTSFAPNFTAVSEDGLGYGEKGLVTQSLKAALERERRTIFACGPQGLLAALAPLARSYGVNCYVAAEAYMACGLGVCLSCGHYLVDGSRIRLCQDGPVVDGLLMDWEKS